MHCEPTPVNMFDILLRYTNHAHIYIHTFVHTFAYIILLQWCMLALSIDDDDLTGN